MDALVVYHSRFGNTKRVAEVIAGVWRPAGTIRLIRADQLSAADVGIVDLLVLGTPTHVAGLPKELRLILEALPERMLRGVRFAAFDTSYKTNWFLALFTAAKRLNRWLRRLGGKQIARPESFFVEGKEGLLFKGELGRAGIWSKTIAARYRCLSESQFVGSE